MTAKRRDDRQLRVCTVKTRRFPVGVNPTRQMLQPEVVGAVSLSIPGVAAFRAAQPIHQKWEVPTWRMTWKRSAHISGFPRSAFSATRYETALKAVSAFFSGQTNPAQNDESLESFIDQVLPLHLYKPEKTLALLKEHIAGPISSYAFTSQFAADAISPVLI
jgi:hypothetical protein